MKRITKFNIVRTASAGVALLFPISGYGADLAANTGHIAGSGASAGKSNVVSAGSPGSNVSRTAANGNAVAVDSSPLIDQIRQITMENRAAVIAKIEAVVELTARKVDRVRAATAGLDEKARADIKRSMSEVEAMAQAVLNSTGEVRNASESEIMKAAGRLAARFESFTESTVKLEAAVRSAGISLGK